MGKNKKNKIKSWFFTLLHFQTFSFLSRQKWQGGTFVQQKTYWIEMNCVLSPHLLYLLELHCVHSMLLPPICHLLLFAACQRTGHCDDRVDVENKCFSYLSWQNTHKTRMRFKWNEMSSQCTLCTLWFLFYCLHYVSYTHWFYAPMSLFIFLLVWLSSLTAIVSLPFTVQCLSLWLPQPWLPLIFTLPICNAYLESNIPKKQNKKLTK